MKNKEPDLEKLGNMLSMVFLPLREEDLNKMSNILRYSRLSAREFVSWIYSSAIRLDLTVEGLSMLDWVLFVKSFVLFKNEDFDALGFVNDPEAIKKWVGLLDESEKKHLYQRLFDLQPKIVSIGDKKLIDVQIAVELKDLKEFQTTNELTGGYFDLEKMMFSPIGLSKMSIPLDTIGLDKLEAIIKEDDACRKIEFTFLNKNMVMEFN
jgi:hypothetical protein